MSDSEQEPTRAEVDTAIRAFWAWWPEAKGRIEAAIRTQVWDALPDEITEKVRAIHPKLAWEMGPGTKAKAMLCVSPQRVVARRAITERWLAGAPAADADWEFHPARVAKPLFASITLEIQGYAIALPAYRFVCEEDLATERFHLRVWHPEHEGMLEFLQGETILVVLDGVLGEDEVERWIGSIELLDAQPEGELIPLLGLRARVDDLAERATNERFCLLDATGPDGRPMAAAINMALKRIDHLDAEVHLEVSVELEAPTEVGLANREELDALNALEDELIEELGEDAAYLGKITFAGGCSFHFFVPDASSAPSRVEAWRARHPERQILITQEADPEWAMQLQFQDVDR